MAIPTTQKECTTRRIASLIIGLWDKVKNAFLLKTSRGAANGVASLDANGKVPSSQLPSVPTGNLPANSSSSAGIVASGNGQSSKVWMTDSSGNPAWRIAGMNDVYELKFGKTGAGPFYFHIGTLAPMGTSGNSDTLLVSGIGNSGAQLDTAIIDILFRGTNPDIAFTFLSGAATGYSNIGWYRDTDNAYHLFIKCANWSLNDQCLRVLKKGNALTIDCYELGAEPGSPTYITPNYVARLPIGTQMGGASVPVYVDSNGNIKECTGVAASNGNYPGITAGLAAVAETLPRSFINKNSQTTKVWKKIATSKVFTTWQKASIAFIICADGYGDALGLESMISVSIRTGGGGSLSNAYVGKYNFRNYCSVELLKIGSTNQYEIWVKAPLTDTNAQIVYLNSQEGWTIDTSSDQSVQKTDSEYSTYKSSNPSVADSFYHPYNIAKSSTSQTGGPSIPVYVNSNGELVACTNVPVIEHVTSIPTNPTVGTIYAL